MARTTGPTSRGKIGNVIFYMVRGRQYARVMPSRVRNPKTEAQQSHRNAFAEISRLSSRLAEAHRIGLSQEAERQQQNTHSIFKHLNKDCSGADGIDYARVVVSQGNVAREEIASAVLTDDGQLTVDFRSATPKGSARDEFLLFVYCPATCLCYSVSAVPRSAGAVSARIPIAHFPRPLHLYALLRDFKGRTSDTIYHLLE